MTACKSCKKSILFAKAERSGKVMPFERDAAGVWAITGGVATHVGPAPRMPVEGVTVERWTSHFATCPHAPQWRARGQQ